MVENKHNKGWFSGLQGESKKSVISGAWCKIVPIFVQISCIGVFAILFEIFFWCFNGPKKI